MMGNAICTVSGLLKFKFQYFSKKKMRFQVIKRIGLTLPPADLTIADNVLGV